METTMKPKLILCLALVLGGGLFGCGTNTRNSAAPPKVEPFESLESVSAFTETNLPQMESFATNVLSPKFIPVVTNMANVVQTNFLPSLTSSAAHEGYAALKFVVELKDKNELPGVKKNDQLNITGSMPVSPGQKAIYPFLMTFHLTLTDDSFTNHYSVIRPAKDAQWQLEKAWRTDAQGHTIKKWLVR
jgi:hypothetical protein